jgi:protein TonB
MSLDDTFRDNYEPESSAPAPLERRDPVVVSETELIPESSLDSELERVLNRLELLYRSLQDSRAIPESTAPTQLPFASLQSAQDADRKRASLSLFSSHIRTRDRREFVIGLSFALSSPLAFSRDGSGRNRAVLIGCMVTILGAFWLGAHHLSNTSDARRIEREAAASAAQVKAVPSFMPDIEPVASPKVEAASMPRPAAKPPEAEPAGAVATEVPAESGARIAALERMPAPAPPVRAEPVPHSLESLKAIKKLTSQAHSLLEADNFETDPVLDPETQDDGAYPSETQQPPVPTLKVIPAYPEEARSRNIAGNVELLVSVDAQGNVTHVEAISGPEELREAAVDAMLRWRFKPATEGGTKVPGTGKFSIHFDPAAP